MRLRPAAVEASGASASRATALDAERPARGAGLGRRARVRALIVATGAARAVGGPGAGCGLLTLRDLDDALALRDASRRARAWSIVGAGFVGCEVAATARKRGAR